MLRGKPPGVITKKVSNKKNSEEDRKKERDVRGAVTQTRGGEREERTNVIEGKRWVWTSEPDKRGGNSIREEGGRRT